MRRVGALLVDAALTATLLIPLNVFFDGLTAGAWLVFLALQLGYFHVCESINGQTVGKRLFDLRVVRKQDAGPAASGPISGRTVLRLIDGLPAFYLIGVLTMILSGKRRQRLGDLAAGTVVTRASARPYTPARRSPLQTVYPLIWVGAALAVVLAVGHGGDPGLAALDRICAQSRAAEAQLGPTPAAQDVLRLHLALINQLYGLPASSKKELAAGNQLIEDKLMEAELLREGATEAAMTLEQNHHQELADLGLKNC